MLFWMTPCTPGHVTQRMRILPLKWPIHIAFSHYSATDQDLDLDNSRQEPEAITATR